MSEEILKQLMAKVDALSAKMNRVAGIAPAWKLDSDRGDPEVRFDPKQWRGQSFKGLRFSEAAPDYLDMLAESYDWMADNPKEGKEKFAGRDRETATLARGWAERIRSGWRRPAQSASRSAPRGNGGGYGGSGGYGGGQSGGYGGSAGRGAPARDYDENAESFGNGPDSDVPF